MGGVVLCCLLLLIEDELLVSHLPLIRKFLSSSSQGQKDGAWVSCVPDPAGEGEESPAASCITFWRSSAPNADILLNVRYSYGVTFTECVKWS